MSSTPRSDAYGYRSLPDCIDVPSITGAQSTALCAVLKGWYELCCSIEGQFTAAAEQLALANARINELERASFTDRH